MCIALSLVLDSSPNKAMIATFDLKVPTEPRHQTRGLSKAPCVDWLDRKLGDHTVPRNIYKVMSRYRGVSDLENKTFDH